MEWHLREAWRSLLFEDAYPGEREAGSPVLPALRSVSALKKASAKTRPDGTPVHSFQTLLSELAMIVCNDAWVPTIPETPPFTLATTPNKVQQEVLALVGLDMARIKR